MAVRIQMRRDTGANWTSNNPILAEGEIGLELDTHLMKIGDGTLAWNALPYYNDVFEASEINANSAIPALTITQLGSGAALLVKDEATPDSTPFVINNSGYVGIGTETPLALLDVDGTSRFSGQVTSTVITGTAPLVIASTTLVSNLNADLLDGQHGSYYAPIDSPSLTGTPIAPTAAVDTNTTQIATTAYVVGQGYLKSATASSTYAPLASPTFTGVPVAPTAAVDTNTTQIATTAYVIAQGYLKSSTASSTYAPLASPTFTGTVTAATLDLTTAATATDATSYFVETGSDGIVRPKTLANVRTEVVTTAAVNSAAATTVGTITSGTWQGSVIGATYIDSAIARLVSPSFTTPDIGAATGTTLSLTGTAITMLSSTSGSPSSNAAFVIERGTDPNVEIRWDETTDKWQYTNDGTTYTDIGTGTGGGGGGSTDVILSNAWWLGV